MLAHTDVLSDVLQYVLSSEEPATSTLSTCCCVDSAATEGWLASAFKQDTPAVLTLLCVQDWGTGQGRRNAIQAAGGKRHS